MKKILIGIALCAAILLTNVHAQAPPVNPPTEYLQVIKGEGEVMAYEELVSERGVILVAMVRYQNYYFMVFAHPNGDRFYFKTEDILEILVVEDGVFKTVWFRQ